MSTIDGATSFGNTVTGDTNLIISKGIVEQNFIVDGDLIVNGTSILTSIQQDSSQSSSVDVQSFTTRQATVIEDCNVGNNLYVNNQVDTKTLTVSNVMAESVIVSDEFLVSSNAGIDGDLSITGNIYCSGEIVSNKNGIPTTITYTENIAITHGVVLAQVTIPGVPIIDPFAEYTLEFSNASLNIVKSSNDSSKGGQGYSIVDGALYSVGIVQLPWNGIIDGRFKSGSTLRRTYYQRTTSTSTNFIWQAWSSPENNPNLNIPFSYRSIVVPDATYGLVVAFKNGPSSTILKNYYQPSSNPDGVIENVSQTLVSFPLLFTPGVLSVKFRYPIGVGSKKYAQRYYVNQKINVKFQVVSTQGLGILDVTQDIWNGSTLTTITAIETIGGEVYYTATAPEGFNDKMYNIYTNTSKYTNFYMYVCSFSDAAFYGNVNGPVTCTLTENVVTPITNVIDISNKVTVVNNTVQSSVPISVNSIQNTSGTKSMNVASVSTLNDSVFVVPATESDPATVQSAIALNVGNSSTNQQEMYCFKVKAGQFESNGSVKAPGVFSNGQLELTGSSVNLVSTECFNDNIQGKNGWTINYGSTEYHGSIPLVRYTRESLGLAYQNSVRSVLNAASVTNNFTVTYDAITSQYTITDSNQFTFNYLGLYIFYLIGYLGFDRFATPYISSLVSGKYTLVSVQNPENFVTPFGGIALQANAVEYANYADLFLRPGFKNDGTSSIDTTSYEGTTNHEFQNTVITTTLQADTLKTKDGSASKSVADIIAGGGGTVPGGTVTGAVQYRSDTGTFTADDDYYYTPATKKLRVDNQEVVSGTASTSTTTGAFTVNGGIGCTGRVFAANETLTAGNNSTAVNNGTLVLTGSGGIGCGGNIYSGGNVIANNCYISTVLSSASNVRVGPSPPVYDAPIRLTSGGADADVNGSLNGSANGILTFKQLNGDDRAFNLSMDADTVYFGQHKSGAPDPDFHSWYNTNGQWCLQGYVSGNATNVNPNDLLTVRGGATFSGDVNIESNQNLNVRNIEALTGNLNLTAQGSITANSNIDMKHYEIHNAALIDSKNNNNLTIEGKGTGDVIIKTNNVNRVTVDDAGLTTIPGDLTVNGATILNEVGIGTGITEPAQPLDVRGNARICTTDNNSDNALTIYPGYKGATPTTGCVTYDLNATGLHYFWDNLETSGTCQVGTNLGVNTAPNPAYAIDAGGSIRTGGPIEINYPTTQLTSENQIGYTASITGTAAVNATWQTKLQTTSLPQGVWYLEGGSEWNTGSSQGTFRGISLTTSLPDGQYDKYRCYNLSDLAPNSGWAACINSVFVLTAPTIIYYKAYTSPTGSSAVSHKLTWIRIA